MRTLLSHKPDRTGRKFPFAISIDVINAGSTLIVRNGFIMVEMVMTSPVTQFSLSDNLNAN